VKKATTLTTKAAQQGLQIAKLKQYSVVTKDGEGQQVATQAELEAMRKDLKATVEQVEIDLGTQIRKVVGVRKCMLLRDTASRRS
jgi:hypothetical protein